MRILDRTTITSRSLRARLAAVSVGAAFAVAAGFAGDHTAAEPAVVADPMISAVAPASLDEQARTAPHADRSAIATRSPLEAPAETPAEAPAPPVAQPGEAPAAPEQAEAQPAPAPPAEAQPAAAPQQPAPAAEPAPAKPEPKPAPAKPAAPATKDLHPRSIPGGQQSFTPSEEQLRNAKAIVDTGKKLNLPPRAWVIAVATAAQESTLENLGHLGARNDHDSQGLFQQRPSSGWGSPKQITDPEYASTAFYKALTRVDGWEKMPLTKAAQTVQVSAYPNHYAKWEKFAGEVVRGLHGEGPYAMAADLK